MVRETGQKRKKVNMKAVDIGKILIFSHILRRSEIEKCVKNASWLKVKSFMGYREFLCYFCISEIPLAHKGKYFYRKKKMTLWTLWVKTFMG